MNNNDHSIIIILFVDQPLAIPGISKKGTFGNDFRYQFGQSYYSKEPIEADWHRIEAVSWSSHEQMTMWVVSSQFWENLNNDILNTV